MSADELSEKEQKEIEEAVDVFVSVQSDGPASIHQLRRTVMVMGSAVLAFKNTRDMEADDLRSQLKEMTNNFTGSETQKRSLDVKYEELLKILRDNGKEVTECKLSLWRTELAYKKLESKVNSLVAGKNQYWKDQGIREKVQASLMN